VAYSTVLILPLAFDSFTVKTALVVPLSPSETAMSLIDTTGSLTVGAAKAAPGASAEAARTTVPIEILVAWRTQEIAMTGSSSFWGGASLPAARLGGLKMATRAAAGGRPVAYPTWSGEGSPTREREEASNTHGGE